MSEKRKGKFKFSPPDCGKFFAAGGIYSLRMCLRKDGWTMDTIDARKAERVWQRVQESKPAPASDRWADLKELIAIQSSRDDSRFSINRILHPLLFAELGIVK
jgi:hypothetical protein